MLELELNIQQQESSLLGFIYGFREDVTVECGSRGYSSFSVEKLESEGGHPNIAKNKVIQEPCYWKIYGIIAVNQHIMVDEQQGSIVLQFPVRVFEEQHFNSVAGV